jgi:hypothetical protein
LNPIIPAEEGSTVILEPAGAVAGLAGEFAEVADAAPRVVAEVFPSASNVPVVVDGELMATAVPAGRLFHC